MKKQLRKPEHWQDFEGLCKKLWGEIWEVSNKIKKNGRLGQPQSGVDVYAIPKGEENYWGIQCKGKDEYTNAKLSKEEIDAEIGKAKTFVPKLQVFIFATTANKDVQIEEYIRLKDLESRQNGDFEIILYSWEDIVDLIEENRETFNYFVNQQQYKESHNFKAYFNNFSNEIIVEPTCIRTIRRYKLKESELKLAGGKPNLDYLAKSLNRLSSFHSFSMADNTNYALCSFEIIMANEGSKVIEDWRVKIEFEKEGFTKIIDEVGSGSMGMITPNFHKRTYCGDNYINYRPKDDKPLVQKDNRYFEAWIEPLPKEYELIVLWTLIARDYNANGELKIIVKPMYEDKYEDIIVDTEEELREREVIEIKAKKNYPKKGDDDLGNFRPRFL
jgi:hypothetical protein